MNQPNHATCTWNETQPRDGFMFEPRLSVQPPVITTARVGDWMSTASGSRIYPLDMRLGDPILVDDIAHHLAQLPHWNGAAKERISIARHSIMVAQRAQEVMGGDPMFGLMGLLHDAYEAYTFDAIRPLKHAPGVELGWRVDGVFKPYSEFEDAGLAVIFSTVGARVMSTQDKKLISVFDKEIVVSEWRCFMQAAKHPDCHLSRAATIPVPSEMFLASTDDWRADKAAFMAAYTALAQQAGVAIHG